MGKGKARAKRVGQGMSKNLEGNIRNNDRACFPLPQVQGSGRGRGVTIGPSRTGGPSHTHPSVEYQRYMSGDLPGSNNFPVPRPDPRVGVAGVGPPKPEETFPKTVSYNVDPSGSDSHLRREGPPQDQITDPVVEARAAHPHRRQVRSRDKMSPTYLKKKIEKLMEDKVALLEQIRNLSGRVINLQESKITGRPVVATRNKATQTQPDELGDAGGESQNTVDLTLLEELSLQEDMDEEAALLNDDRPLQICLEEVEVGSDGPLLTPPSAE